jgi:hypothetical protein
MASCIRAAGLAVDYGRELGSLARSLTGPGAPAWPAALLARAENVRRREMIPGTTLTDLNHVDPELGVFHGHFRQFRPLLHPSFIPSEFVSVDVGDVGEPDFPADGAGGIGGLTVELGGPQQIRMGVADVGDCRAAREYGRERRAARETVVDDRSPHARQVTTELR